MKKYFVSGFVINSSNVNTINGSVNTITTPFNIEIEQTEGEENIADLISAELETENYNVTCLTEI